MTVAVLDSSFTGRPAGKDRLVGFAVGGGFAAPKSQGLGRVPRRTTVSRETLRHETPAKLAAIAWVTALNRATALGSDGCPTWI